MEAQTHRLPIDSLHPHPDNSNRMPRDRYRKLVLHLKRSGRYPPIIVRPMSLPEGAGEEAGYQILDGHHRIRALRELGHEHAVCSVWRVDEDEALLMLATLNRLEGSDDPYKRSALLAKLSSRRTSAECDASSLARFLPENVADIERLLKLQDPPPPPSPPTPLDEMPVATTFFFKPDVRRRLLDTLADIGPSHEAALLSLLDQHVAGAASPVVEDESNAQAGEP